MISPRPCGKKCGGNTCTWVPSSLLFSVLNSLCLFRALWTKRRRNEIRCASTNWHGGQTVGLGTGLRSNSRSRRRMWCRRKLETHCSSLRMQSNRHHIEVKAHHSLWTLDDKMHTINKIMTVLCNVNMPKSVLGWQGWQIRHNLWWRYQVEIDFWYSTFEGSRCS